MITWRLRRTNSQHTPLSSTVRTVPPGWSDSLLLRQRCRGERVLEPLRKFGGPILDGVQAMPFPAMQSLLASSFPDGNCNYWKSTLQRELSDEAISAIVEHANRFRSPLSFVFWNIMAVRGPSFEEPLPSRTAIYVGHLVSCAVDRSDADKYATRGARSGEEMLRPFSQNAHLLSVLDIEADDVVKTAFGPNLPRLAAIKKKYDPTNFFRVNQNISIESQAGVP